LQGRLGIKLRIKCASCGFWNRIEVNKVFVEQKSPEEKVAVFIPMYHPVKTEPCQKCKTTIAEPQTLIRIIKT
jgi:RNase P subunit RPR2